MKYILTILCGVFLFTSSTQAASFLITPRANPVSPQDEVMVSLVFEGGGVQANALEGSLDYDQSLLQLTGISQSNTLITFWAVNPEDSVELSNGHITFSGVTPGGFGVPLTGGTSDVVPGNVFSAHFTVKHEGTALFTLSGGRALAHDGLGTPLPLSSPNLSLHIVSQNMDERMYDKETEVQTDTIPPESFIPILTRHRELFDNQWVLIFSTLDKTGSIDHFEVREGLGDFEFASSPYVLKDQSLGHAVWVKAVDDAGNETIVRVSDLPRYDVSYGGRLVFGSLVIFVLLLVFMKAWRRLWNT